MKKELMLIMMGILLAFGGCIENREGREVIPECEQVEPGQVRAVKITSSHQLFGGRCSLGKIGDYKLQNANIAVIIQDPSRAPSFIPFGGYIIDAVPVGEDGCPKNNDHFGEMAMFLGYIDLINLENSFLRGFRPTSIEIIQDGSQGGKAIIQVKGTDAPIPYIEAGLLSLGKEEPSQPMNLEITTEYILEPDSNLITIQSSITNPEDGPTLNLIFGEAFLLGDGMRARFPDASYNQLLSELIGEDIYQDIRFWGSTNGKISYAYGLPPLLEDSTVKNLLASFTLQNISIALNQDYINQQIELAPGETKYFTRYLMIKSGDINQLVQELFPLWGVELVGVEGEVIEEETGLPAEGVWVEISKVLDSGTVVYLSDFLTDEGGRFSGLIPGASVYQAFSWGEARISHPAVSFPSPRSQLPPYQLELKIGAVGRIAWEVKDPSGKKIPVRLTLLQNGQVKKYLVSATGEGEALVVPGTYEVWFSRGPEYTITSLSPVEVIAGAEPIHLQTTLMRVVDTSGFIGADLHLHAEPSPDSELPISERISACLAEGLEFIAATDHDHITDYNPVIKAMGVSDLIKAVPSEEVSSPILGHFNAFPLTPDPEARANGAIDWFKKSAQETFDEARNRLGAVVVQVNHPRDDPTGYFYAIKFNRQTGQADETDPTKLGLDPEDEILNFDFDAFEVYNDRFQEDDDESLLDWFTLLNLGHRVTITGNSDSHRISSLPGWPRNYIASSTDNPGEISVEEIMQSVLDQKVVVSAGAFVRFNVNGIAGLGETITDTDGEVELNIEVQSPDWVEVSELWIVENCNLVQVIPITAPASQVVKYQGSVLANPSQDSWYVVIVRGSEDLPLHGRRATDPRAITNPIYVDVDGNGIFDPPDPPGIQDCDFPSLLQ